MTRVRLLPDRVEKYVGGSIAGAGDKYEAMWKVAIEAGFIAPRLIGRDADQGILLLERIRGAESIGRWYCKFLETDLEEDAWFSIVAEAGRTLAALHLGLDNVGAAVWRAPTEFVSALHAYGFDYRTLWELPSRQLHGDFGFSNVLVSESSPGDVRIAVIDPCADGYSCDDDIVRGPVHLDIGKFILCLEGLLPLRYQLRLKREVILRSQIAFLDGYGRHAPYHVDWEAAFAFAYGLGALYLRKAYPWTRWVAGRILYNHAWKRNAALTTKMAQVQGLLDG